jgi:hypothetical protein
MPGTLAARWGQIAEPHPAGTGPACNQAGAFAPAQGGSVAGAAARPGA